MQEILKHPLLQMALAGVIGAGSTALVYMTKVDGINATQDSAIAELKTRVEVLDTKYDAISTTVTTLIVKVDNISQDIKDINDVTNEILKEVTSR